MIVLGLTGSIATGKSATGAMFNDLGIPVLEADAIVHRLYAEGGAAVALIAALVPEAVRNRAIDRAALSTAMQRDPCLLAKIETIVHPLVREAQHGFVADSVRAGHRIVVLDIPLLFEKNREGDVDRIVVTTCAPEVQRARALARTGMTVEKLDWILARQMPDAEKRQRAHFVIDTGQGFDAARQQVAAIIAALEGSPPHA